MGYSTLKAALDAVVRTNGQQQITGANLNGVMTTLLQGVDVMDRENPADTSGMNHVVLKSNKTFAEQVTGTDTIYEIRDNFNLGGNSVTIPTGCILFFNGGKLSNGTISIPSTTINYVVDGYSGSPTYKTRKVYSYSCGVCGDLKFNNVKIDGKFETDIVDYSGFEGYSNDNDLLDAILSIGMRGETPCVINLEPGKTYSVTSDGTARGGSMFEFIQVSNKEINGNGATIKDLRNRHFLINPYVDAVFGFWESSYIKIHDLEYRNETTDWNVGIVYDLNVAGATFIKTLLDCHHFDVDISVYGVQNGFSSGEYNLYWWNGNFGLQDSRIKVVSNTSGYPVVINMGQGLDIWVHSETDHRSAYLLGLSDSKVYIESKDHYSAPFPCLLCDTRYSDTYGVTNWKGYHDLDIVFRDLDSQVITGQNSDGTTFTPDAFCVGFPLWGVNESMSGRDTALVFSNINVNIYVPDGSKIGSFSFVRGEENASLPQTGVKDVFENVTIKSFSGSAKPVPIRITFCSQNDYKNVRFAAQEKRGTSPIINNNTTDEIVFVDSYVAGMQVQGNIRMNDTTYLTLSAYPEQSAIVKAIRSPGPGVRDRLFVASDRLTPLQFLPSSSMLPASQSGYLALLETGGLILSIRGKWFSIPLFEYGVSDAKRGTALKNAGATSDRPSHYTSTQHGFPFFDTTLGKPIWESGYSWREFDGEVAGVSRSGDSTSRPTGIKAGFVYFDTTLGKPIWFDGTNWVDATGTAV